jgi:hypothetical protein
MVGGDAGEVSDILGEQRIALGNRHCEHIGIRSAAHPDLGGRGSVDAGGTQRPGQCGRIHLVE